MKSQNEPTNFEKPKSSARLTNNYSIVIGNKPIKAISLPIDSISTGSDFFNTESKDTYRLDSTLAKKYLYGYYDTSNVFVLSIQYISKSYFALILYNYVDCESSYILVTIDKNNFKLIDRETILNYQDCSEDDIDFEMKTIFNGNHFMEHSTSDYWTNSDSKNTEESEKKVHKIESFDRYCEILETGRIIRKESKK